MQCIFHSYSKPEGALAQKFMMCRKQCCQFEDFVAKFSYFLVVAVTFKDVLRQGAILAIFK